MPFTFLLGLGAFAVCILWMVDVDRSRIECRRYLEAEATKLYSKTELHDDRSMQSTEGATAERRSKSDEGADDKH